MSTPRHRSRDHVATEGDTAVDQSTPTGDVILSLTDVSRTFGGTDGIRDLTIDVHRGELLTLLGPSGCGKTTTLRTIAGLERPDAGQITIDDTVVADDDTFYSPEQRDVGLVFQEFALFPHLTAAENVAFGIQHLAADARADRVDELFDLVGLQAHREQYPEDLSGGQKQRVALARALAPEPALILLDEPFSNLDRDRRVEMREEVRRILTTAGVTAVFVTHDQEEALAISDRIAVVRDGRLEQVGHPEAVFQRPASRFVADFFGDAGFLPGVYRRNGVQTPLGPLPIEQFEGLAERPPGTEIDILVRPDDVTARTVSAGQADGHISYRRYRGPMVQYRVRLADGTVVECLHNHTSDLALEAPVAVEIDTDHRLWWFPRE